MVFNSEDFILREVYGQYLIMPIKFNTKNSQPILLNSIGADIVKTFTLAKDVKQGITELSQLYSFDTNGSEWCSIENFINNLENLGILEENH